MPEQQIATADGYGVRTLGPHTTIRVRLIAGQPIPPDVKPESNSTPTPPAAADSPGKAKSARAVLRPKPAARKPRSRGR